MQITKVNTNYNIWSGIYRREYLPIYHLQQEHKLDDHIKGHFDNMSFKTLGKFADQAVSLLEMGIIKNVFTYFLYEFHLALCNKMGTN